MKSDQASERKPGWVELVEARPLTGLPGDPGKFITQVLGYQFTRFQRRWWKFTAARPHTLVLAPRGHGKSTILTIAYTLYRLLSDHELRALIVSNTAAQASAFLREIRAHLDANPWVLREFGGLKGQPWTEAEISLATRLSQAKEASVTALGVGGPIISKHYDLVILDDVVDEEAARSRRLRQKLLTWHYKELLPTLEPHGELHVIGTRYHHDDLYGRLISDGLPHLVDRAIIEQDGVERALWPKKFPLALLRKKREAAGPAIFNAQYQNDVTAMMGAVFRPEWIRFVPLPECGRKFQGVDLAIGSADHHDYFAHVTVGESSPGHYFVLSAFRARLSFEEQFRTVQSLFAAHDRPRSPVVLVGIEANSYQEALAQRLRGESSLPVASVVETRDKIARAYRLQGLFETGRVSFPEVRVRSPREDDLSALIEELLSFPDSDHDDLVDALGLALSMAAKIRGYGELPVKDLDLSPEG